ncbi:HAD-like domain-containing protein [Hypoxylon sp. NC1633]|nr:HAD-like domain-containing protein [Hypoxylon sp. NC1633]
MNASDLRLKKAKPKKHEGRDKIVAPSLKSGGVPDPSPEYLATASLPPFQLPHARQILVAIDLNGTILHRPDRHRAFTFVERPYARTFLSYCVNTFKVVIWSSAKPVNVYKMCRQLLTEEDQQRCVAVWGRDRFGLTDTDYNTRVQCYKRLSFLWNDPVIAASHPESMLGKRWSQADTLLVDDSFEKARSEPYNLISLPEFTGNQNESGFILPQVHDYINECARQTNISAYIRTHPFKLNSRDKRSGG